MAGRPLPTIDDCDTAPFFEAAKRHELAIQLCSRCEAVLHVPRAHCPQCGSWQTRWQVTNGLGRVYSWTVVEHQVVDGMPTPHTIVLVELEQYPAARLVGHIPGAPELTPGQLMQVWFEHVNDDVVLPQWKPALSG